MNEDWIRQAFDTLEDDEVITKYVVDDMKHQFYVDEDTNIDVTEADNMHQHDDGTIEYFSGKANNKLRIVKYIAAACIIVSIAGFFRYEIIRHGDNSTAHKPVSTAPTKSQEPQEAILDVKDFSSVYVGKDNKKVSMEMDKQALITMLGEADEQLEEQMWESDGCYHQDLIYAAQGLEINMVKREDNYHIYSMTVSKGQEAKTAAGIAIESTKEEIEQIYKNNIIQDESSEEQYVIGNSDIRIVAILTSGKVSRIYVGYCAE